MKAFELINLKNKILETEEVIIKTERELCSWCNGLDLFAIRNYKKFLTQQKRKLVKLKDELRELEQSF